MKRILVVFVVGVLLFGASAGVSWFLQRRAADLAHDPSAPEKAGKGASLPGGGSVMTESAGRPAIRPSPVPNPDNVAQLAANLRHQQEIMRQKEQQVLARQKHLELIFQDMKNERKTLDDIRAQIGDEMKTLQEKMEALERKAQELDRQKQKMTEQAKGIKDTLLDMDRTERAGFKHLGDVYNSMDPESGAEIVQHMVEMGKMEMAVKILGSMRERQAAAVLALIPPQVAVQLVDKMKDLKRASGP
jgi:flagellar motility protein MotE (MotC chaperone)